METFGEWLQQQRSLRRLTRKELARCVGCSVSALQKIEYGERRPSVQIAELMANCLGVPMDGRSTFVRVARGEWRLDRLLTESKPAATLTNSPSNSNLPVFPTPMIGREREVEEIGRLLHDPQCRLLNLVGPGGIGKTRLAVEAASRMQDVFDHGVYFVPLASVGSLNAVVSTMANAIHFAFYGASDPKVQILSYLREKRVLLIVDNVEHLLARNAGQESVAELVVDILRQAEQVKLLITSRESLELRDEWLFDVEGLPIPDSIAAEGSAQNTSVELFLQRARRAHVGFSASVDDDYPAIARICRLVDGNPLGIELAAAWVRTLSCDEIAQHIERGLDFLRVTTRDLPARHRSMRAVFDHSWRLLPGEEKQVLARLSVFRGWFRREAAQLIAGATLPILSALIAKSLVRRGGENRYDLHELVRQFAAEHLSKNNDEQIAVRDRHSNYYLSSFSRADTRMRSPAQKEALAEWTAEMDNIRVAWDWAVTEGKFGLIEEALRAFAMLYETRGLYREGLEMLERAIGALEEAHGPLPADRTNRIALGHLLTNSALLTFRLGRHEEAQALLERSLEILRPLNDARYLVEPITYLGVVMSLIGDYASAMDLVAEARDKALTVGDRIFAATSLSLHANFSRLTGQSGDQHARLQAAVAEWRAVGDPRFTAYGLNFLGQSALALGRYDEARRALEESVELNTSVGARWNLGHAFQGLGAVAEAQGEYRRAAGFFRKAVDTFTELGGLFYIGQSLAQMGRSLFALGNDVEAERIWRESLRIAAEIRGIPVVLETLVGLASLRAKRGETQFALELLLIVLNHPARDQETKNRASALQTELEAQLTSQQVEAVREIAQTRTLETIVEHVLMQAQ